MPNYEVEHVCPLTISQRDEVAAAITRIHSDKFETPKLFVNIRFTDIKEHCVYVAGKRRSSNRIFAYVRHGPSRTQADYEDVSRQISTAWDSIVPLPRIKRSMEAPDTELRMVMFYGSIQAVYEAGFMMPAAGGDVKWLEENMHAFEEKASAGDEEFKEMIQEVKARRLV